MTFSDVFYHKFPGDEECLSEALGHQVLSGKAEIVSQYESDICAAFCADFSVATSSGSAALHSSLAALGLRQGDEVIVPAIAPLPTALPILAVGATPVFVDCDKNCFDVDSDDLEKKITNRTSAILLVYLWGYPIKWQKLFEISRKNGIPIIEDAAQAHFSSLDGRFLGTLGDAGCFSTHDRKLLATGEGGFVLTAAPELEQRIRNFSRLGHLNGRDFGLNYRLPALSAALGKNRLRYVQSTLKRRREVAGAFIENFSPLGFKEVRIPLGGVPNYYGVAFVHESKNYVKKLREVLYEFSIPEEMNKYNIDVCYKKSVFGNFICNCVNSEDLFARCIAFITHPDIQMDEIKNACDRISKRMAE